jgi:hypothetical protein
MKKSAPGKRAPAGLRWLIHGLSVLLTFLFVWLLGFVLSDIGDWDGPSYQVIEQRHVDEDLRERETALQRQIRTLETRIQREREIQETLRQGMDNARSTMEQMMELHRLSLEQKISPNESEQQALAVSQTRFLDAQEKFQEANEEIAASNQSKFELNQELSAVRERMKSQSEPAQVEYREAHRRHEFKVAALKLAFIVPFLVLAAWLVYKKRSSLYRPIYLAGLLACFWKVGVVMFDHFPREFFKYIAIAAAIAIVLSFLVWLLRNARAPGAATLLKRFREAYATQHCPICAYPIARGPLKQAVWTRRGPRAMGTADAGGEAGEDVPYACPSCGTRLFEKCPSCAATRHSLLPYCEGCGEEKNVPELRETGGSH